MNENKNSRKKALIIFTLVFLAGGGGVFIFFVFQGLGDFNGYNKGNFHYSGFGAKALLPLLNYFNLTDGAAERAKTGTEAKGLDGSPPDGSLTDVSDWMTKSGRAGARGALSAGRTAAPRMGGGLGGISGAGGGGSQTTSGLTQLGGPGGAGNTRIAKGGPGGEDAAAMGKGTVAALANTRAMMKEGIRSGSAMTAKSKWDQGFVGTTGARTGKAAGGSLAYGKPGLVKLDTIQTGDIADLKTPGPGTLSAAVPPPVEDTTADDPAANKAKVKAGADAAKQGTQNEAMLTPEAKQKQLDYINTATEKELEDIKGIGPVLAGRIIAGRPWKNVDELIDVKGIGPKNLETMRPFLSGDKK